MAAKKSKKTQALPVLSRSIRNAAINDDDDELERLIDVALDKKDDESIYKALLYLERQGNEDAVGNIEDMLEAATSVVTLDGDCNMSFMLIPVMVDMDAGKSSSVRIDVKDTSATSLHSMLVNGLKSITAINEDEIHVHPDLYSSGYLPKTAWGQRDLVRQLARGEAMSPENGHVLKNSTVALRFIVVTALKSNLIDIDGWNADLFDEDGQMNAEMDAEAAETIAEDSVATWRTISGASISSGVHVVDVGFPDTWDDAMQEGELMFNMTNLAIGLAKANGGVAVNSKQTAAICLSHEETPPTWRIGLEGSGGFYGSKWAISDDLEDDLGKILDFLIQNGVQDTNIALFEETML
jgi:hypothetical protein